MARGRGLPRRIVPGRDDIAQFMEQVAVEDGNRAKQCHEFLKDLSGSPEAGDAVT